MLAEAATVLINTVRQWISAGAQAANIVFAGPASGGSTGAAAFQGPWWQVIFRPLAYVQSGRLINTTAH